MDTSDLDALATLLARERPGLLKPPLTARLVAGGRSNLTYVVTAADGTARILRRPPLGHVLSSAHDMAREFRVIKAIRNTAVPVPEVDLLCNDTDVIGAPFYTMQLVSGIPYRHSNELEALGPARTALICDRMLDTLVALHAVDPSDVGLTDFGRPAGYLGRQVRRWQHQLDASCSRDLPGLAELHSRLASSVPPESGTSVVHGDFRLDNLLVDERDQVAAVLDWEMATLGDPLLDIALLVAYSESVVAGHSGGHDGPLAPGYPPPSTLLDAYARKSGRDTSGIGFYLALAYFKMVGILEGIHYRYLKGQTLGEGFEEVGVRVPFAIAAGLAAFERG